MNDITTTPPPSGSGPGDRIIDEPLSEALSRRYLAYALSVITDRALPDVRDGLKPVQRRVLYAMREMRLNPESAARKCAKVVGEV
ncbi:MAG: parC, partial [Phenylobacterium sp.]|uniref:DNA gyrase subunit A n=1 Tax=Phenylobacterium sp. TaxID=1871053 RepID=UPI00260264FB